MCAITEILIKKGISVFSLLDYMEKENIHGQDDEDDNNNSLR